MGADAKKTCFVNCLPVTNPSPVLLWKCKFVDEKGTKGNHPILQPVVGPYGKEIYLCTKGSVIRVNAETGAINGEWKGSYTGEATLANGSLFITGPKGLSMLERETGKALWEFKCERLMHAGHWAWSPLEVTVSDGLAFFGKGMHYDYNETDDGVYAVKIVNGERAWRAPMGKACIVVSAVAVEGDRAVCLVAEPAAGSDDLNELSRKNRCVFRALDTKDGSVKWEYLLDCTNFGVRNGPSIKDGIVYGADAHFVFALRLATGEVVWKKDRIKENISPKKCFGTAAVISGDLVVTALAAIEARDRKDGMLRWEASLSEINFMAAAGDVLYVGCYHSDIYAYSMKDGKKLWTFATPEVPDVANSRRNCRGLAVADGRVYFTTYQGVLFCLGQDPRPISDPPPRKE